VLCRGFKNAYSVFAEEELRELTEDLQGLKAAETSFEFWDNEADAVYDNLLPAATFPLFTDWWMANSKFGKNSPSSCRCYDASLRSRSVLYGDGMSERPDLLRLVQPLSPYPILRVYAFIQ